MEHQLSTLYSLLQLQDVPPEFCRIEQGTSGMIARLILIV
jgi:hypothetical protein